MAERKKTTRRRRKDAANSQTGIRKTPRGWALPAFSIDEWFTARFVPGHRRGGFRAWIRDRDDLRIRRRSLQKWDILFAEFQGSAVR